MSSRFSTHSTQRISTACYDLVPLGGFTERLSAARTQVLPVSSNLAAVRSIQDAFVGQPCLELWASESEIYSPSLKYIAWYNCIKQKNK